MEPGQGGGVILIFILSTFLEIEQHTAQAVNLVFFLGASLTAIVIIIKDKLINWKIAIPVVIFGIIGAVIGASISIRMNVNSLKRYFGIFLGIIAIFEIYSSVKKYILDKKKA